MKRTALAVLAALLVSVSLFGVPLGASADSPHKLRELVTGTFRTPTGGSAACTDVPPTDDCQVDRFFGDIGGPDNGVNQGADDEVNTVFIHFDDFNGKSTPGAWTYRDKETIRDFVRNVTWVGFENGVIDGRSGGTTTGQFSGHYEGTSTDGCSVLVFDISGFIDISGIVDQSGNPVNNDSGMWIGQITAKC